MCVYIYIICVYIYIICIYIYISYILVCGTYINMASWEIPDKCNGNTISKWRIIDCHV